VVRRRQLGIVVDRARVLAVAAGRLDGDEDAAEVDARQHEVAAVAPLRARRRAPRVDDRGLEVLRQLLEPRQVLLHRQARDGRAQLRVGEVVGVVAAGGDQAVDERVAVVGDRVDPVAGVAEGLQQRHGRRRRVEPDGVADPRVLGREAREHHHHLAPRRRRGAQPREAHGHARDGRAALGVGHVGRGAVEVRVGLLERHDAAEQPPVELGDRDLHRDVHRAQAGRALGPRRARARHAHRLDHRDAERGERVGAPGALVGAGRAAGRQDGDDHGVDLTLERLEDRDAAVAVRPQRLGPHAGRHAAGGGDRAGELVDERRVAGREVRAVEDDRHARSRPAGRHAVGRVRAVLGQRDRVLEPVALEQERVGQEPEQVGGVGHAAVAQVLERLGGRRRRRVAELRQLGVGLGLAAQQDEREAGAVLRGGPRAQGRDPLLPRAAAAEQAHDHDPRAVEQGVERRGVQRRRVGDAHRREAGGQRAGGAGDREQVGVGVA
jgi:hypothetical protein